MIVIKESPMIYSVIGGFLQELKFKPLYFLPCGLNHFTPIGETELTRKRNLLSIM